MGAAGVLLQHGDTIRVWFEVSRTTHPGVPACHQLPPPSSPPHLAGWVPVVAVSSRSSGQRGLGTATCSARRW